MNNLSALLLLSIIIITGKVQAQSQGQEPEYPGGLEQLNRDLAAAIVFPEEALDKEISGRVMVRFVVDTDGYVREVEVVQPACCGMNEAAIAAVKQLKAFTPAMQDGAPVKFYYSIPVSFVVEEKISIRKKRKKKRRAKRLKAN